MIKQQGPGTPLAPGDAVRLLHRSTRAATTLGIMGDVWIVQRFHPYVWCLKGQAGILVRALDSDFRRWIAFPNDPNFEIKERLAN